MGGKRMGGKGKGARKGRAPRWASAVPGQSPWVMWSPCDIPESDWDWGRPTEVKVHLFPETPDTPEGMDDRAQDADEGNLQNTEHKGKQEIKCNVWNRGVS